METEYLGTIRNGSIVVGEEYHPIDSSYDYFKKCMELFDGDVVKAAEAYYTGCWQKLQVLFLQQLHL